MPGAPAPCPPRSTGRGPAVVVVVAARARRARRSGARRGHDRHRRDDDAARSAWRRGGSTRWSTCSTRTPGIEIARRVLPDPVPVAAMVVDDGVVHVVSTRKGEPIFWYALTPAELVPCHRRIVAVADGLQHDDVLDAWATPDGGLWLELDAAARGRRRCACEASRSPTPSGGPVAPRVNEGRLAAEGPPVAHDACAGGHELFVPLDGRWSGETRLDAPRASRGSTAAAARARRRRLGLGHGRRPAIEDPRARRRRRRLRRRDRGGPGQTGPDARRGVRRRSDLGGRPLARERRSPGDQAAAGGLGARRPPPERGGPLPEPRPRRRPPARRSSARVPTAASTRSCSGRAAATCSTRPSGDLVLAHRENKDGRVEVGGFAIDLEGRLLGRRAVPRWTIDLGDLGGAATVYAGAGRGRRSRCALGQRHPHVSSVGAGARPAPGDPRGARRSRASGDRRRPSASSGSAAARSRCSRSWPPTRGAAGCPATASCGSR